VRRHSRFRVRNGTGSFEVAERTIEIGIDVSHANGTIDWKAVARAGIGFAYAKATEGANTVDHTFTANCAGMKDAGILRGAYHFFRPDKTPQAQADSFLRTVGQLGEGDLPPALDLEETSTKCDRWRNVEASRRVPMAVEWLERVEKALGRTPIVYTRRSFVQDVLGHPGPLVRYPLWVAHYTCAETPAMPPGWPAWAIWQHSDCGRIEGVSGRSSFAAPRAAPVTVR
jgi:lysozyme